MIVKSSSRKDTDFNQMVSYVLSDKGNIKDPYETFTVLQNIVEQPSNIEGIAAAFKANDQFRPKRKNGISVSHEILSFHQEDSEHLSDWALESIARKYIELRAGEDCVCLAKAHHSDKHIHIHFLFHSRKFASKKSIRLDKRSFSQCKKAIQDYEQSLLPQLNKSYNQNRNPKVAQTLLTEKEFQAGRVGRKIGANAKGSIKEGLQMELIEQLKSVGSIEELKSYYQSKGICVYERNGQTSGLVFNGRKYRFLTLLRTYPRLAEAFLDWEMDRLETEIEAVELAKEKKRLQRKRAQLRKKRAKLKDQSRDKDRDDW